MLRAVLPFMRNQKAGHIINISSIIGYKGTYAGWGCYVATKFAVSGLTEALAAEVKSLGIKATVVYPGAFRTSFLTKESLVVTNNELLAAYPEAKTSLDLHLNELAGNQEGDPEKAATALIEIAETENPPLHLFLGKDSFNFAEQQIENVKSDLETWKELSLSTGY
jgi:short-subunit dehydrogenase